MRISDWSSDVCSSDLLSDFRRQPRRQDFLASLQQLYGGKEAGGGHVGMEIAVGAGADAGCEEIGLGSCRNDENAGARIILTEPAEQFRLAGRLGTEEQDTEVDDGGSIKHALPGCFPLGTSGRAECRARV